MPSHKERVIIEYFGDVYHIYWQNSDKEILGCTGKQMYSEICKWDNENYDAENKTQAESKDSFD